MMPTKATYSKYLKHISKFQSEFDIVRAKHSARSLEIYKFEMIYSECFDREYLAAFANPKWFQGVAPNCDAGASPELITLGVKTPPVLVIPGKTLSKKSSIKSIVEHEIVHVNQALRGDFPELEICTWDHKIIYKQLLLHTIFEFQANFVQLVHNPELMPSKEFNITLEEWCHLRGFTSGVEKIVLRFFTERHSEKEMLLL
ncbi:MAG: hypothetical protein ACK5P5_07995, partial [Pseudobdellovibrionaceae bacterium]